MATSEDGGGGTAAYECPIEGCRYVSQDVQAVEGHVSGMRDGGHEGLLGRDVREAIQEGATVSADGRPFAPSEDTGDDSDGSGGDVSPSDDSAEATVETGADPGAEGIPEKTPADQVAESSSTDGAKERVARQWNYDDQGDGDDHGGDVEQADVPEAVAEAVVDSLDDQGDDHGDGAGGVPVPTTSTLATAAAVGLGIVVVGQLLGGDDGDDPGDDQKRPDQPRQGTVGERWQGVSR